MIGGGGAGLVAVWLLSTCSPQQGSPQGFNSEIIFAILPTRDPFCRARRTLSRAA